MSLLSEERETTARTDGYHKNLSETSELSIFLNMTKAMIGAGVLASPYAAYRAGILIAIPMFALLCMLNIYQIGVLIRCYCHICEKMSVAHYDLGDLVYFAFKNSRSFPRHLARIARIVTNILIFLFQFGANAVYIIFIGSTMRQIINEFHSNSLPLYVYFMWVTLFLVIYIFIHDLDFLSYFSLFANICTLIGVILVFYYSSINISPTASYKLVGDVRGIAIFFGAAIYSIEGITLVLPLYSQMEKKPYFMGIYTLCLAVQVIITWGLQLLGNLKYGKALCGLVALNLPLNATLSLSARFMFICSVFVSYGLQFYVVVRLVLGEFYRSEFYRPLIDRVGSYKFETVVRCVILLLTLGASIGIPYLSMMMSVLGAFCGISLGLLLPAVVELLTYHDEPEHFGRFWWKAVLDYIAIIGGMMLMILVLYVSIIELIDAFNGYPPTPDSCRS